MENEIGHIKVDCRIVKNDSETGEGAHFSLDVSCRVSDYVPFLDHFMQEVVKANNDEEAIADSILLTLLTKRLARNAEYSDAKIIGIAEQLKHLTLERRRREQQEASSAPQFTDAEAEVAARRAHAILRDIAKRGGA